MANDEHVAMLEKGGDAWRLWRHENPDIRPDLSGANLSEAYSLPHELYGANLDGASLYRANIGGDLTKASLRYANLDSADLSGADLSGADLSGADLNEADLEATTAASAGSRDKRISSATTNPR